MNLEPAMRYKLCSVPYLTEKTELMLRSAMSAPGVVGVSSMPRRSSSMSDSCEGTWSLREDSCRPSGWALDGAFPFLRRRCDLRSSSASMAFTVYSLDK